MQSGKYYTFTTLADEDAVELKRWSRARWGKTLTRQYMLDIHAGVERIAKNYKSLRSRDELTAGTGLSIYPVREHYVIFYPVAKAHIVIVAVLRQGRDIPNILRDNSVRIGRELREIQQKIECGKLVIT